MFLSFDLISLILLTVPSILVYAQNNDLWPAAYPLAVRSPYLQAWEPSTSGSPTMFVWPSFWVPSHVCIQLREIRYIELIQFQNLGWVGYIRIDSQTYRWLGEQASSDNVTQPCNLTSRQVTPTSSIFIMQAGPMTLNVTFLSPIEVSAVETLNFGVWHVANHV